MAIVLANISYGQILTLKNAEVFLKSDSLINGNVRFLDISPDEILVNDNLINLKLIDSIKNNYYKFKTVNYKGKHILLSTIVEGNNINLYKEFNSNNFYAEKDEIIYLLEGGKVLIKKGEDNYSQTITKYKGVLNYLTGNKLGLQKEIKKLQYTENSIKSFVEKQNTRTTYIQSEIKKDKNYFADTQIFLQYSHLKNPLSYQPNPNTTPNSYQIGVRTYVKEGSRSSFSTSIQYGKITWEDDYYVTIVQMNINYILDFYNTESSNWYLNFRLLDATYLIHSNPSSDTKLNVFPRVNFSFGYRYHIVNKMNLFVELNELFNLDKIPTNFSFGFSYVL